MTTKEKIDEVLRLIMGERDEANNKRLYLTERVKHREMELRYTYELFKLFDQQADEGDFPRLFPIGEGRNESWK